MLAFGLLTVSAHPSRADPPRIQWVRGEGADACPDAAELMAEVVRRSDGRLASASASSPSVEAVVVRDGETWIARIHLRDARGTAVGEREVRTVAPTCRAIASAVALAALVAIEPGDPPAPSRPAPAPAVLVPPRRVVVRTVRRTRGPVGDTRVFAVAFATAGSLPGLAAGGGFAVDARVAGFVHVSLGLGLTGDVDTGRPVQAFAFGLAQAWALGCIEGSPVARVSFAGCAGGSVGLVHATAYAPYVLQPDAGDVRPWFGPTIGGAISLVIVGPVVARLALDVTFPLARYAFSVQSDEGSTVAFEQSPVTATGTLGLGMRFR